MSQKIVGRALLGAWLLIPFALILVILTPRPAAAAAAWTWPVAPPITVMRGFEPPPGPYAAGHRGADLFGVPGDAVVAAGAGRVTFAGPLAGRGVVVVSHGGLRTTYEPVTATVDVGDAVAAGQAIGTLEAGGSHCWLPCLHWGLLRGEEYLNPLTLVERPKVRLLPHLDGLNDTVGAATLRSTQQPTRMDRSSQVAGRADATEWEGSRRLTAGAALASATAGAGIWRMRRRSRR